MLTEFFQNLDGVLLARVQFAFTIAFHILFPAFTIGLAAWLAVLEGLWLKTDHPIYKDIYRQWSKIFAVVFGVGVVTGIVMPYQFGTNWSGFIGHVGNVIGPLLGFEVLTAFFLESSFLGIMLFGWGRVSPRMHFVATCIVSVGTMISAFWILSANSWMQTPQAYEILKDGTLKATDWLGVIFNPSFPYRFAHMILAAFLTTAFAVGGTAAWYLLKKKHIAHARVMLGMAMIMALLATPIQIFVGDLHGLNTLKHQPAKVAAMEGHWQTGKNVPLVLLGHPNEKTETTKTWLSIPSGASFLLKHNTEGKIKGLKDWPKADRPPVATVFWSFRIMVGLGLLMLLAGVLAAFLWWRGTLFTNKIFLKFCLYMSPAGFIAILAGWFVTEVGRQPYLVYGVLRTANMVSPVVPQVVAASLLMFMVVYLILFGSALYYILKLIKKGPTATITETFGAPNAVGHPTGWTAIFPHISHAK
jgi:cytochrome bd ubiquinol oxidase subunit I